MKHILPVIVISQFFCTSLWFAGNAIMPDLADNFHLAPSYAAHLSSAVQLGFIAGTLVFALLSIADRFSPSKIFLFCAIAAAVVNISISLPGITVYHIFIFRLLTGFFLAGIYPVGMKIAADHYEHGLGKSLGFLVGALVLGTAFPHLLKSVTSGFPWRYVLFGTSFLALAGGISMYLLVPEGPYRKSGSNMNTKALFSSFSDPQFRSAAIGYFGHMWELYAFWVFLPLILTNYHRQHQAIPLNTPMLCFSIIAVGAISCVGSGLLSKRFGVKRTAGLALLLSGLCCLISPLVLSGSSTLILLTFLTFWSMVVIADSPLFSTLVAQSASPELKGTALTLVNCIGFSITIVSIQLINTLLSKGFSNYVFMWLAIGPIIGLIALSTKKARLSGLP